MKRSAVDAETGGRIGGIGQHGLMANAKTKAGAYGVNWSIVSNTEEGIKR